MAGWRGCRSHDLFGDSDGFRRPGYAFSIEPGFSYSTAKNTVALAVPWPSTATARRTCRDIEEGGEGGDAAFADYLILASYIHRF